MGQLRVGPPRWWCALATQSILVAALGLAGQAAPAAAQSLPSGWAAQDIGGAAPGGGAGFSGGTFTIDGGGANIWGTADQFTFVYRQVRGDGAIVVRLAAIENAAAWAKAGIMFRESLAVNSKHAFAMATPSNGVAFQRRVATGGTTARTIAGGAAPAWLRLERRGSTVTASQSPDGAAWTTIGSDTVSMSSSLYVGLAVTSTDASALARARFERVQLSAGLPAQWSAADVGRPSTGGIALQHDGVFTLQAAGAGIGDVADQFTFAYAPVSGDVDVVARVSSLERADHWSKAGVMIRASLRADAAHASLFATALKGVPFERRPAAGMPAISTSGGSGRAPLWVKLERRGTSVTAFRSSDGETWKMIGGETLSLPSTFYVGLAVSSHTVSAPVSADFDGVSIVPVGAPPSSPPPSDAPIVPTTAKFGPSADHATGVTSYFLEIFKAGSDPAKARPVGTRDLGKPAVVLGECTADIATTIAALPSGDYFATIVAIGPGGTSARALSAAFRR